MKTKPSRQVQRARGRAGLSTPQRQRGAAAVFAAVALIAGVIALLLGINVGMLYFAQRDLQRLAVLGAMAGVQTASGCINGNGSSDTATVTIRVKAALSNNLPSGTDPTTMLSPIGGLPAVQLGKVSVGKAGVKPNDGQYHFSTLPDHDAGINAVVVNLTRAQPVLLGGSLFSATPGTLYASATAMQQPLGGFSIGSTLIHLDTATSILNPLLSGLLGATVNLSAVDYNNMADTHISLAGLMLGAGVNDLNSLLALNTNVAGLQQILVTATNLVNPSAASLIQGLALGTAQANQSVPLATLLGNVGNGLNPTVNDVASLVPSLDLLDLLQGLGQAAAAQNPNSFLTIQATPSLPAGLLSNYVFLSVQQPMQPGFGPVGTQAQTAQVTLHLRSSVDTTGLLSIVIGLLNSILGLLGSGITIQPINIGLDLAVAKSVGTLASLVCPTNAVPHPSATVGVNASAATLTLGTFTGNAKANPALSGGSFIDIQGKGLLGLISATVGLKDKVGPVNLGNSAGAVAGPFVVYGPGKTFSVQQPHNYNYEACNSIIGGNPLSCGATQDPNNPAAPIPTADILQGVTTLLSSLLASNNLIIHALGIDLSAILDPLLSAVNTLLLTPLTQLLDSIVNPLLAALGIQLASGTVLMNNVETGQPVLVNTALPGTPNF